MKLSEYIRTRKGILSDILSIFLISRLLIVFIASLSDLIIIKGPLFSRFPKHDSLLNLFYKWDSQWYMSIVQKGYSYIHGKESNVGFFPLYPLLVKIFSSVFGNLKLAGFIISNIALLLAVIYLYKLIMLDFADSRIASKTVFYMLISPLSFFFSIFYTEGLFLFLTISAFYYARKREWLIASTLGCFTSLVRAPGVLITIPFLIEYFDLSFTPLKIGFKKIKSDLLYLLLIPAGLFSFMLYLYIKFGDALVYYRTKSEAWGMRFTSIFATLGSAARYYIFYKIIFIGAAVLALILIIYLIYRRVRVGYTVYALLLLFSYLSTGLLEGIPRYISVLFPLYLGVSLMAAKSKFFEYFFSLSSIMLLTFFTILFVNGYWFT